MLPPIGKEANTNKRLWVRAVFRLKSNSLMFRISVEPTTDLELRRQAIVSLSDECGFKTFFKNKEHIGNRYAALGSETVIKWKDEEELDDGVVALAVRKKLDQLVPRLASVRDKLSPLFENYPAL